MTDWFLAQVKPNADSIAKRNLERQGFQTFQPMGKRTIAKAGRLVDQIRPYFSGYIFVSYPAEPAPWSLVNSTYGVGRLVRFGERPAPVPANVIAELRSACNSEGVITLKSAIVAGAEVKVIVGAFSSFLGQIEHLSPGHRAMILLDFMGKKTRVNVPLDHLQPASVRILQPMV